MPDPAIAPLILGSGGVVGRALTHRLEEVFPGTVSATRAELDVTDRSRLEAEVERLRPSVLINCAALNDPEDCEEDPGLARRVNAEGAENAARAAAACGCRLVHVSTALVFDGRSRAPYKETDAPEPLSVYGRTRLEGERLVATAAEDHLIVRTSWMYGGCTGFVETIRMGARRGAVLRVASGETGSPTCVVDLATALLRLLTVGFVGVVHFANSGICSRYVMAETILETVGRAGAVLEPVAAAEPGRAVLVPANVALDTSLYTRLTGDVPRSWQAALRDYLIGGTGTADA